MHPVTGSARRPRSLLLQRPTAWPSLLLLCPLLLLSACSTNLTATTLQSKTDSISGQLYSLPRIDYQINLERELQQCSFGFDKDKEAVLEWMRERAVAMSKVNLDKDAIGLFKTLKADAVFKNADLAAEVDAAFRDASGAAIDWRVRGEPTGKNPDQSPRSIDSFKDLLGQVAVVKPKVQINVELRASATPVLSQDTRHVYALRYQGMAEWFKATDYAVKTYPNGTLKSVNVTLDDQTGAVVQGVLSGAAKIAAASGGFPLSLGVPHAGKNNALEMPAFAVWKKGLDASIPCTAQVQLQLLERKALKAALAGMGDENLALAKATGAAEAAYAKAIAARDEQQSLVDAAAEGSKERKAALALLKVMQATARTRHKELDDARSVQDAAQDKSGKIDTRLVAVRKTLTESMTTMFLMETGTTSLRLEGVEEALKAWLDPVRVAALCQQNPQAPVCPDASASLRAKMAAQADLYPSFSKTLTAAQSVSAARGEQAPAEGVVDLIYRQPLRTTLFVCKEVACLGANGLPNAIPANRLLASPIDVPQMGLLASLPLRNGVFQNNTFGAAFAENGALLELSYKSNAQAAKAAAVFDASADTYLKFSDAKRKQESEKLKTSKEEIDARTNLLKAQLEQEKAQAELDKFRAGQPAGATTALAP